MGTASSSVLRVRCYGTRLTLRGPRSGGLATVHPAPLFPSNGRVLTARTLTGFRKAAFARPLGPEPRTAARLDQVVCVSQMLRESQ